MTKVVIYARYSPGSQQNYQSIEGQLKECFAYAKSNNYEVIREYIDEHLTGRTDKRPEFLKMIEDSKKKAFSYIIVYQLDRFARNRYDSAMYKNKLNKNGVKVLSARENITDDASGVLIEGILESMAEYYSVELSQKVKRGIDISASKFKFYGGAVPFGYKIDKEKNFIINELTAPIVIDIYNLYSSGKSFTEIINNLNERKILNSRNRIWTKNSLSTILKNKKYIGQYIYKTQIFEDVIPKIVPLHLFEIVQKKLKIHNAINKKKEKNMFILTGKIFCGLCQSQMIGESGTSRLDKKYYYYKCSDKKHNKNECNSKAIPKDYIENLIVDVVIDILGKKENQKLIAENIIIAGKNEKNQNELVLLKKQEKEVSKAINNILDALEKGIYSNKTKERLDSLENELNALHYEIGCIESEPTFTLSEEKIVFWLNNMFENAIDNEHYKDNLINTFINKIIVYDDKIVIIFNFSDDGKLKEHTISDIEKVIDKEEDTVEGSTVSGLVGTIGIEPMTSCL